VKLPTFQKFLELFELTELKFSDDASASFIEYGKEDRVYGYTKGKGGKGPAIPKIHKSQSKSKVLMPLATWWSKYLPTFKVYSRSVFPYFLSSSTVLVEGILEKKH